MSVVIFEVIISNVSHYINSRCEREALLSAYKLHLEIIRSKHSAYPFDSYYVDNVLSKIESIDEIISLIPNDIEIKPFS